jgi:hypothetical protein
MLKRSRQLVTRLTQEEYDCIIRTQKLSGLSGEVFRRNVLLGVVLKEAPPADYFELIRQLRILGNNINQIARVANACGMTEGEMLRREVQNLIELEKIMRRAFETEKEGGRDGNYENLGCQNKT